MAAATPAPGGRGPACRETANRVGRIQHRDYGWPGGFARLRLRRPGGELGAFTARTKAMTRRVGSPSPRLQNASAATNTSSATKTASVSTTIHGTQAIPANNITAPAPCRGPGRGRQHRRPDRVHRGRHRGAGTLRAATDGDGRGPGHDHLRPDRSVARARRDGLGHRAARPGDRRAGRRHRAPADVTVRRGQPGRDHPPPLHQGGPRDTDPEVGEWSGADDPRVDLLAPSWRNIWTRSSRHRARWEHDGPPEIRRAVVS